MVTQVRSAGFIRRARNDDQVGRPPHLALADGLQPLLDDLLIGAAGAEAEHARGRAGLDLGGQRRQFVEQSVIAGEIAGAAHLLGDLDEAPLGGRDRGRKPLRFRQAEQGQRAIGLEFDARAAPARRRAPATSPRSSNEDPHEAGRAGLEVGGVDRGAVGILGHRKARTVEQPFRRGARRIFRQQMQVDRHQQRAGLRHQPHRRCQRCRIRMERHAAGIGRHFPGIGGEFRMLLPAQDGGAERRPVMLFAGRRRRAARATSQNATRLARSACACVPDVSKAKCRTRDGTDERRERPGVNLAEDGSTQRMRRQPRRLAVADQNIRAHRGLDLEDARSAID